MRLEDHAREANKVSAGGERNSAGSLDGGRELEVYIVAEAALRHVTCTISQPREGRPFDTTRRQQQRYYATRWPCRDGFWREHISRISIALRIYYI